MNAAISALIEQRVSTNKYDPTRQLSDTEIAELVRLATLAPTAFNLQNWKFIAVRTAEAKGRLKSVAYGQQKVVDAAVTFIVCGVLAPHEGLDHALRPSLEAASALPKPAMPEPNRAVGRCAGKSVGARTRGEPLVNPPAAPALRSFWHEVFATCVKSKLVSD